MEEHIKTYIHSISIFGVKTYKSAERLLFGKQQEGGGESTNRWNLIIGDNGTGKTTALQLLSALILHAQERHIKGFKKYIDLYDFVPKGQVAKVSMELISFWPEEYWGASSPSSIYSIEFEIREGGVNVLAGHDYIERLRDIPLIGFGASRKMGASALSEEPLFPVASLFDDNAALGNPEEWLLRAMITDVYDAIDGKSRGDTFEEVKELLLELFKGEIHDIELDKAEYTDNVEVLFQTDYGRVNINSLSLGYRTLMSWMVELARFLYREYKHTEKPLSKPAVCLVDEIDLHLHPKLQHHLVSFLQQRFPNVQFVVTAHSPLIAQAFATENILMLRKEGEKVEVEHNPVNIRAYRLDQVLTSDLFGLSSSRNPEVEKLIEERRRILGQAELSAQDEERVRELETQIGTIPMGEDKYQIKAYQSIQKLAEFYQNRENNDQNN